MVVVVREERAETERRSGDGCRRIREKDIASFKWLNAFEFVLT